MKHIFAILILLFTFNVSIQAQKKVKINQNFENNIHCKRGHNTAYHNQHKDPK